MKLQPKIPSQMNSTGAGEWIVDQLIPARSLILLSAAPKLGKSILSTAIAAAVATGEDALKKYKTRKGKVLLIALEDGEAELRKRIQAVGFSLFHQLHEIQDLHVVAGVDLRLDKDDGRQALEEVISRDSYSLIVLDNLSRLHALPESDARSMRGLLSWLKSLKDRTGTSILLIAHDRKAGGKGGSSVRGSGEIWSWPEALLHLRHDAKQDQLYLERVYRNFGWFPEVPVRIWESSSGSILNVEQDYAWSDLREAAKTTAKAEVRHDA